MEARAVASLHPVIADPEKMTGRARAYLTIGALRHLATGTAMILMENRFTSASFIPIINLMPLWVWGVLSFLTGSVMAYAAMVKSATFARWGLVASASLTGMIATGLVLAALMSSVAGVIGAFVYISVTLKDLVQCLDPIRSPFEYLFRRWDFAQRDNLST